jgi:hypothetical protein
VSVPRVEMPVCGAGWGSLLSLGCSLVVCVGGLGFMSGLGWGLGRTGDGVKLAGEGGVSS